MDWNSWYPILWDLASHGLFLAVGLGIAAMIRWWRRYLLRAEVEGLLNQLQMVCEPDTLSNPNEANLAYMASQARNEAERLRPRLEKAGLFPPANPNRDTLVTWFEYVRQIRVQLRSGS